MGTGHTCRFETWAAHFAPEALWEGTERSGDSEVALVRFPPGVFISGGPVTRLYTIVPADLSTGAKIAQTGHGVGAFFAMDPERAQAWQNGARNIVCLQAPDLPAIAERLMAEGCQVARFTEPDLDDRLTCLTVSDAGARWVVAPAFGSLIGLRKTWHDCLLHACSNTDVREAVRRRLTPH